MAEEQKSIIFLGATKLGKSLARVLRNTVTDVTAASNSINKTRTSKPKRTTEPDPAIKPKRIFKRKINSSALKIVS